MRNQKIKCKFCDVEHSKINHSKHLKTKKCRAYQKMADYLIDNLLKGIETTRGQSIHNLVSIPYTNKKGDTVHLTKPQYDFFTKLHKSASNNDPSPGNPGDDPKNI
jgi:hypothetical protein